jgi:NADH-quinone oxidoreductase subunit F
MARIDYLAYEGLNDGGFESGTMMGSGGFMLFDEDQCIVRNTWNLSRFYHHESCGQCSPCSEGTGWLEKVLHKIENGHGTMSDIDLYGIFKNQLMAIQFVH